MFFRISTVPDTGDGVLADEKEKISGCESGRNTVPGSARVREILDITGITITETGEPGKGARSEIVVPEGGYRPGDAAGNRHG